MCFENSLERKYGRHVYAKCTAGDILSDACGIGFDESRCVINSDQGDEGGGDDDGGGGGGGRNSHGGGGGGG